MTRFTKELFNNEKRRKMIMRQMASMRIGKYTISFHFVMGKGFMFWIEADGGEGAEFSEVHIQEAIDELWKKHF